MRVVVTLRADYYDRPLLHKGFGGLIQARTQVVLPMSAKEVEQAITGPANRIGLLSNNPDKSAQLAGLGITIARQVPTALHLTRTNAAYLATKARRGGHDLLVRGLERAAEPHWHADPLAGPADLGSKGR